jgi:hypothetical protein
MNVSFKNLVAGGVLAFSAITAQAANVPEIVFDADGSGGFSATVAKGISSFTGSWLFNVPVSTEASASVTSNRISLGVKDLTLTGFYVSNGTQTWSGSQVSTGPLETWVIDAFNVAAGTYELFVSGSVVPKNGSYGGGSFGGQIGLAAPVPEPETWGMMVGGLALVGMLARRRKAANDKESVSSAMIAA